MSNIPPLPQAVLPYATPQPYQQVGGVWRDGDKLVTMTQANLPDRCVKCNAPANGFRLKRTIAWHPTAYYALIVAGVLVYAIVALVIQKKATVHVGLCPQHRSRRRTMVLIGWLVGLGGLIAGIFLAVVLGDSRETDDFAPLAVVAGIAAAIVGTIVGVIGGRVLKPTKIDDHYAWFGGCSNDFLAELPPVR